MIWHEEEEEWARISSQANFSNRYTAPLLDISSSRKNATFSSLNDALQTIASDIRSDIYHKTVGYGLIAVGAGVLVSTRGVGWKPAAVIMSTGLNNLAEVN